MSVVVTLPDVMEIEFSAGQGRKFTETLHLDRIPESCQLTSILGAIERQVKNGKDGNFKDSLDLQRSNTRKSIAIFESGVIRPRGRAADPELKAIRAFLEMKLRAQGASPDQLKKANSLTIERIKEILGTKKTTEFEALFQDEDELEIDLDMAV
jgi:hypothetical protein